MNYETVRELVKREGHSDPAEGGRRIWFKIAKKRCFSRFRPKNGGQVSGINMTVFYGFQTLSHYMTATKDNNLPDR
ncbi:MAG: hypothetical protein HY800_02210 [Ignavibacteriales bacterium]|nr:hypothetical protein [Ignavibacteriales bacterium]